MIVFEVGWSSLSIICVSVDLFDLDLLMIVRVFVCGSWNDILLMV